METYTYGTAKVLPQEHAAKNKALRQQSAGLAGEEQEDPWCPPVHMHKAKG